MTFKCTTCGEEHAGLPMDVAFGKPGDYLAVPAAERATRCLANDDLCVIDGARFYVRGCLEVPVSDSDKPFVWGLWARVDEASFRRYRALYDQDGANEPPFEGNLSCEYRGYEGLDGLHVELRLGSVTQRPRFHVLARKHKLFQEQREGITMHCVQEILSAMFPDQFT